MSIYVAPTSNLRIRKNRLFLLSFFFSLFSLIWMFIILKVTSPNQIVIWEAVLTILFYSILLCVAFMIDIYFIDDFKDDALKIRKFERNTDKLNKLIKVNKTFK